jgi:carbon-monoxide dehydrogenase medium subunit
MIPAPFEYEVAESVEHAIELLGSGEDAKLLAGGHSLLPLMKLRFSRPSLLVDVGRLPLDHVREDGDEIAIGALARHHELAADPLLAAQCPIVPRAAAQIGDRQVRHRGTIGGSVAHADPAGDLPSVLLALDATFVAHGPDGERRIAASDFFRGVFETALGPRELLTEVRVPKVPAGAYVKFVRRAQDWATVGVAAVRDGSVRVALTHMAPTPVRARGVEDALASGADAGAAAERADEGTEPVSDASASADFRRHLAQVLVRRALEELEAANR